MSSRARVVLDSNVVISAQVFGRGPGALWRAAVDGKYVVVTSPALLAEVTRILGVKFSFSRDRLESLVVDAVWMGDVIEPELHVAVCADEPDNRVLECAAEGRADFIATGDAALLALASFEGIEIVTVAAALERLGIEEGAQ